jgi:cytochrome c553
MAGAALLAVTPAQADDLTPLGKWMKANIGKWTPAAYDSSNPDNKTAFAKLKASFDVLVTAVPSDAANYADWAAAAQAGSAAAAAGDVAGVKKACNTCHGPSNVNKKRYKKDHASDPAPADP